MRTKVLVIGLWVLFVIGCSGMPVGNSGGTISSGTGEKLTKEKLKKLGIEETKGADY